jgi:hypothetical protein
MNEPTDDISTGEPHVPFEESENIENTPMSFK